MYNSTGSTPVLPSRIAWKVKRENTVKSNNKISYRIQMFEKSVNAWMNEWMNEWMHDGRNEWINEGQNEWMNEWMDGCVNEWLINEWMKGWMDGGWMNEWVDGSITFHHFIISIIIITLPLMHPLAWLLQMFLYQRRQRAFLLQYFYQRTHHQV